MYQRLAEGSGDFFLVEAGRSPFLACSATHVSARAAPSRSPRAMSVPGIAAQRGARMPLVSGRPLTDNPDIFPPGRLRLRGSRVASGTRMTAIIVTELTINGVPLSLQQVFAAKSPSFT